MVSQSCNRRRDMFWLTVFFAGFMPRLSFGESKVPFTYSISVGKHTYAIGEPIAVMFELTNVSAVSQKIKRWRGPLAGVTQDRDEFDFAVYRIIDKTLQRVVYKGMFACGPPSYMVLKPNESWQETYVINNLLFPAYVLEKAGEYVLRSTYFSHGDERNSDSFSGKMRAKEVRIKVVRLSGRELRKMRKDLGRGEHEAIAIAAAHRDANFIPLLAKLCSSEELQTRKLAHKALGMIGTDDAIDMLGEAVASEPNYSQRIEITRIFVNCGNLAAATYLKNMLKDPYTSVIGMNGKKYRQYTVRKWASMALNKLGVEDNTPYLEEFKEEIETMPEDRRNKLFNDALSKDPMAQFEAVAELATSGYCPASVDILSKIACDYNAPETTRSYAAMGLRNFTSDMPAGEKAAARKKLKNVVATEILDTPDGIIRVLVRWEAARFVYETLGEQLKGHTMEIEVLEHMEGDYATERLWQIYQDCPKRRKATYYNKRASAGRALVNKGDVRGIDILMELLPADKAPGPQYRHNIYTFLAIKIGNNFGYEDSNYRPELEQAIPKMISWWGENRSSFELP